MVPSNEPMSMNDKVILTVAHIFFFSRQKSVTPLRQTDSRAEKTGKEKS